MNKAKEILELASISTYTKINQERLGSGVLAIEKPLAINLFQQQIHCLIAENNLSDVMKDVEIFFTIVDKKICINSKASILTAFNQSLRIEKSLEFIIDPVMEGPS